VGRYQLNSARQLRLLTLYTQNSTKLRMITIVEYACTNMTRARRKREGLCVCVTEEVTGLRREDEPTAS